MAGANGSNSDTPMKRVRITLEVDVETGGYEIWYNNVDFPGEDLDYTLMMEVMGKVFMKITSRLGTAGEA